jgi:hypothetical protein
MDTTELWEDDSNKSPNFHDDIKFRETMGSEFEFKFTETRSIILTCTVCVIAIIIVVLAFCFMVNRCRSSGKIQRRRSRSEGSDLYQNSEKIRLRMADDSLETIVNRPLPHPPDMNRQSAGVPAIPENDYVPPINIDSHWHRRMEEIGQLPPAPPVFPGHLQRLPLDGEGAYIQVIPDDEAPLLSPGPMQEITHDQQLGELSEESGYMVPKSPTQTSLQQNVTEKDHSPGRKELKYKGNEYKMIARAVVTPNGEEQQCPRTSKRRSLSESASVSSDTQNEREKSKDTKGKKYLSTCQLYLSPPTKYRRPPVPTRKPTVVVYKTKLNSMALVRERTIPTERPPPVGEVSANFCG